jgi:hypothetical protein
MSRQKLGKALALAGAVLLAGQTVRADIAPADPVWMRVATADVVVAGRVVAIEDQDIKLKLTPLQPQPGTYRVAIVAVTEQLKGAAGLKQVRVAFDPVPSPRRPYWRPKLGQQTILRLTRHHEARLFTAPGFFDATILTDNPGADAELKQFRYYGKQFDNAAAGLKSTDGEERFLAAALLIKHYRTPRPAATRQEPLAAPQSKLVLNALLGADWEKGRKAGEPNPYALFIRLGLTEKDGWKTPTSGNLADYHRAARTWLRRHAEDYRIQRFVREPAPAKKTP